MSQSSQTCIILYCNSQDHSFRDEILSVDRLFFNELEQVSEIDQLSDFIDSGSDSDKCNSDVESDTTENLEINADSDIDERYVNVEDQLLPEPSVQDIEYAQNIETFKNQTCGCKKLYGQPCSSVVDFEDLVNLREYCASLDKDEHDLIIQSALYTHRQNGPKTTDKYRHAQRDRHKPSQRFFIKSSEVCRKVFCFAYNIGREKLLNIGQSLDQNGLQPRTHGNKNKMPHNALKFSDREQIHSFIIRYAQENAMPLPGRLPNHRQSKVMLLPSDRRQADVHQAYIELASVMGLRLVSLTTFVRTWHELCPQIVLCKPSTDLCHRCQDFTTKLNNSGNVCEQQKSELLESYRSHISQAQLQRDEYKSQCENAKILFSEGTEPCFQTAHYSWDFAQQVFIPHHSQQVGPIYFKTPRKCEVFGVCCEGSEKQVFYLADEGLAPGKGANTVISYVHHYLQTYGLREMTAQFHFDNCCGQNKNNAVSWYAMWRVMAGLHVNIRYSLMVAGHTEFSPDWHFGLWKSRWRRVDAETIEDVAASIQQSSRNGHNIPHIADDETSPVKFYDWKSFLGAFFKPLKNISKFHSFVVSACNPGVVICKEFADSQERTFSLLRNGAHIEAGVMPKEVHAPGLDADRQWYLYDNIRQYFRSDTAKDKTCPLPKIPKSSSVKKLKIST